MVNLNLAIDDKLRDEKKALGKKYTWIEILEVGLKTLKQRIKR